MNLSEVLEKTGLNQKEASVYLALLQLGTASVQAVANRAGVKRPTTYLILDDLRQKGLASLVPRAKKALYQAEDPETLTSDLTRRRELVARFMPDLRAVFNAKKEKPEMQLFEGELAVKQVYDSIFAAKEVKFFSTIRDFLNFYPDFVPNLKKKAKSGEMKVQEILTQSPDDIAFARDIQSGKYYEHRFAAKNMQFMTDNAIADDSAIFFSYAPTIFAVKITSQGITQSLRVLFAMAWAAATPYDQVIKVLPK